MGIASVVVPLRPSRSPSSAESDILGGADGARARLRAVGGWEACYELAIRQVLEAPAGGADDLELAIHDPESGTLEFGWSEAAGACSTLAAYARHLVIVRAFAGQLLDDLDQVARSGRFVEVRGRVAERNDDGLSLQAIRADEPHRVPMAELTDDERVARDQLERRCLCPACFDRTWSVEEADALAEALEQDVEGNLGRGRRRSGLRPSMRSCPARSMTRPRSTSCAPRWAIGWRWPPSPPAGSGASRSRRDGP